MTSQTCSARPVRIHAWALALAIGAWLLPVFTPGAQAVAITSDKYDNFDYPTGNLAGSNGGAGFASAWGTGGTTSGTPTVVAGSSTGTLNDPFDVGNRVTLTGGAVVGTTAGNSPTIFRTLNETLDAGTVYLGFELTKTSVTNRTINLALYNGATERLSIGQNGSSLAGNIVLTLNNGTGATYATSTTALAVNTTFLLVLRVDFDASGTSDRLRLYINPTSQIEAEQTSAIDSTTVDIFGFDRIRPFAGGGQSGGQPAAVGDFDSIRITSTFGSAIAVPEPGSAVLLGVSSLGFLGLVRRRRGCTAHF